MAGQVTKIVMGLSDGAWGKAENVTHRRDEPGGRRDRAMMAIVLGQVSGQSARSLSERIIDCRMPRGVAQLRAGRQRGMAFAGAATACIPGSPLRSCRPGIKVLRQGLDGRF